MKRNSVPCDGVVEIWNASWCLLHAVRETWRRRLCWKLWKKELIKFVQRPWQKFQSGKNDTFVTTFDKWVHGSHTKVMPDLGLVRQTWRRQRLHVCQRGFLCLLWTIIYTREFIKWGHQISTCIPRNVCEKWHFFNFHIEWYDIWMISQLIYVSTWVGKLVIQLFAVVICRVNNIN
jgi:hypothetical protein